MSKRSKVTFKTPYGKITFLKKDIHTNANRPIMKIAEIRRQLHLTERMLRNFTGHNKTTIKYHAKICYMLYFLRLYPCEKKLLDNWSMPDYNDIMRLKKHG